MGRKINVNTAIIVIALIVGLFLVGGLFFDTVELPHGAAIADTTTLDLADYPETFVTDGTFNGYFVVGENAKITDSLAITEIASNMKIEGEETTTEISGDSWQAEDLEMANSDASAGSIQGENLRDVSSYIGKEELGVLADGVFRTTDNTYTYSQYLYFDVDNTATNELVKYSEDESGEDDVFFFIGSGNNIAEYRLEFDSGAKSDIYDATGSASSSGTILKHFEDTQITLSGKEYTVVLAARSQTNSVKLTLMEGATSGSLLEGETEIFQLNGDTYNIGLTYVDTTSVQLSVNDEITGKLRVGDIYKLADGKEVGISEILYQGYAGGTHKAEFFVGADKLELGDGDISDSLSDTELKIDGETIDGANVIITGTDDGSSVSLSAITINIEAQDDYYLPAGSKLSSVIESADDDHEVLFTNNWDIEFKGLSNVDSHEIKLDSSSSRKYDFVFYDGNDNKVDLPLFYAVDDTTISFGEDADEKCLILKEGVPIYKNDFFVLTGGDASGGSALSFALEYKGADRSTATSPKIKFKNIGSGNTLEYSIDTSSTAAGSAVADIKLGGYTFSIVSEAAETNDDFAISISGSDDIDVVDYYGASTDFGSIPATNCRDNAGIGSSAVTITTADSGDYGNQAPSTIVLTVDATATNQVTISSFTVGGTGNPLIGESNTAYGYTSIGGMITYTTPGGSPEEFTYDYPKEQRVPLLYLTGAENISSSVGGNWVSVDTVGTTKLDSEVGDLSEQNLIVVGGPCVNTVAAELLGGSENCEDGFVSGKSVVKLVQNGDNVAMLVIGYGGEETKLASKVVANRWTELSGDEVEITGDNYIDAEIGE